MMEILLGAGSRHDKRLFVKVRSAWNGLVTVDFNAAHKPDIVADLSKLPLPFGDDVADEIHAYDVMEHTGAQGDWRFFFDQWSDLWRILKPGGYFHGVSPHWSSPWAWMDPGHTRAMGPEMLTFLHQPAYAQVGKTAMSDYRFAYKADFDVVMSKVDPVSKQFFWVLRAVKPSRISV